MQAKAIICFNNNRTRRSLRNLYKLNNNMVRWMVSVPLGCFSVLKLVVAFELICIFNGKKCFVIL